MVFLGIIWSVFNHMKLTISALNSKEESRASALEIEGTIGSVLMGPTSQLSRVGPRFSLLLPGFLTHSPNLLRAASLSQEAAGTWTLGFLIHSWEWGR